MTDGYFVTPDNTPLFYSVAGQGDRWVILLHGGLGDSREMIPVASALDLTEYKLVLLDFRGHGKSFHGKLPLNYDLYATDVLGLMDHLGIEKASIVGYSDGAITALVVAYSEPDRITRVVSIAPDTGIEGWRDDVNLDLVFPQIALDDEMIQDYEGVSPETEKFPLLLDRVKILWESPSHIDRKRLAEIKAVCWIVGSDSDEFIKQEDLKLIAHSIPFSFLHSFSNLKHGELTPALAKLTDGNIHILTEMLEG